MCGILAVFGKKVENFSSLLNKLKNRGPEDYSIIENDYQLGFTRLSCIHS